MHALMMFPSKLRELSVVIPVKRREGFNPVPLFIKQMNWLWQTEATIIVIDSGGGEALKPFAHKYIQQNVSLWEARKLGYENIETLYTMNLDDDNIVPKDYVLKALNILSENSNVIAVAIDYEVLLGHYGFGTSVWKTEWLKQLYDWNKGSSLCECCWMWSKIHRANKRLETLPYRAKHLKPYLLGNTLNIQQSNNRVS